MRKRSFRLCLRLLNQFRSLPALVFIQFRSLAHRALALRQCRRPSLVAAATCALVNVVEEIAAVTARVIEPRGAVAAVGAAAVGGAAAVAHAGVMPGAREQLSWMLWWNSCALTTDVLVGMVEVLNGSVTGRQCRQWAQWLVISRAGQGASFVAWR